MSSSTVNLTTTVSATPSSKTSTSTSPHSAPIFSNKHDSNMTSEAASILTTNVSQARKTRSSNLLSFIALTTCLSLVALDTVLLPTALPTISKDFHLPNSLYAWTGSAYLLVNAASVPFWGRLSDVFGRKPIAMVSILIFLIGSILCGVSRNAVMLVGGRAVQGLGGGGVVILVHICVTDMFSLRDRSFFLGVVGAVWAVASALGPVLGGVFAEKLNWRWCFYINIPFVSLAAGVLFFTLNLPNPRTPLWEGLRSIDWLGSASICVATLLLLIGLQFGGQDYSWNAPIVILFIVFGFISYVVFFLTQWKLSPSPIMPLRIFKDRSNLSALGVCACDALIFNSVAYFLPLYFQIVLRASPLEAGVWMLSLAIPLAIVSLASGYIMNKTGRYLEVLRVGMALMAVGVGLLISLTPYRSWAQIIGFLVVLGIGFGPNFHAPLIALQTRIEGRDMAAGTATFGFVRMVSGAIGVVLGQVVFQSQMRTHLGEFIAIGVHKGLAVQLAGGDAISIASEVIGLPSMQQGYIIGTMTRSLRGTWIFYTAVGVVGFFVSFGIIREQLTRDVPVAGTSSRDGRSECDVEKGEKRPVV